MRFHNGTVRSLSKVDARSLSRLIQRGEVYTRASSGQQQVLTGSTVAAESSGSSTLVEAMAHILRRLSQATLDEHGFEMSDVLLTIFPWKDRRQGGEVLLKATRLARLRPMLSGPGDLHPDPVGAAAAAHGIGLCNNFTKIDVCQAEEEDLPLSLVLGVEYTLASLTVTMSPFQASREGFGFDFKRHWDLGSDYKSKDRFYWQRIKEAVLQGPRRWPGRDVTDIVLMGESALEQGFLHVLQDALWEVLPEIMAGHGQQFLVGSVEDPGFAAARGAAEIAKRLLEAPDGCVERAYCERWRRWIG